MGELARIAIRAIKPSPIKMRSINRESETYRDLCASIKNHGQLGCITVRKMQDYDGTYYEIIDGLARYWAMKDCNFDWIDVDIIELSDDEVLQTQIMKSVHEVETKPIEYSRQLKSMLDRNPSMSIGDLADRLGKSTVWLSQRLMLNKITDPKIQELIDHDRISLINAYTLARLPEDEMVHWVDCAEIYEPETFIFHVTTRLRELRDQNHQEYPVFSEPGIFKKKEPITGILAARIWSKMPAELGLIKGLITYDIRSKGEPIKVIDERICIKGWDNIVYEGQNAYLRNDVIIRKHGDSKWHFKHPTLKLLNCFEGILDAMIWAEENLCSGS